MIAALILLAPFILLALYTVCVQTERGGAWRVLLPVAWVALVLDVVLNFLHFAALFWDWPQRGEWTLSKRLTRLNKDPGWRGHLARPITRLLDWLAPSGQHIKT
ncbi:MAG: hypothetical protein V4757_02165 [Pseudomonadota bacterium]